MFVQVQHTFGAARYFHVALQNKLCYEDVIGCRAETDSEMLHDRCAQHLSRTPDQEAHMAKKTTDAAFPTFEMPKFEMPSFDMPKFDMPKMEVPEAVRQAAEKSLSTAKEAYEKSKLIAEEATDVLEDTYASASKGSMEIVTKAMDNAKVSTDASFTYGKQVLGAKSVAELVELNTSFARAQFDAFMAQSKEITELLTKVSNDASAPMKAASEKAMAQFKKSA